MNALIGANDPQPVRFIGHALAPGPFVLLGDHAGNSVPATLGRLGLDAGDLERHIAIDIGSRALGEALSARLDAPFVAQDYSRLVIDCNRDPAHPTAIVPESDATLIHGNRGLSDDDRRARVEAVFAPYHEAIADLLNARAAAGLASVLVSLHSFTPVMDGHARPWDIGVLHDGREDAFARRVLAALENRSGYVIGDNEPYRMDATDYTLPRHAYPRALSYVEIEVRQDLLPGRQAEIAAVLAEVFAQAL